jgi:HAD superfamily hydrolase (TIGR01484 family)
MKTSSPRYDEELDKLHLSYASALSANIEHLKIAIAGASSASIIGVGSGGSFTVASLLCNLHETYTGRVSRASTPLELISNPDLAAASPVFLISAEGKNPDIVEALKRARSHSARTVHVLTNRSSSPLADCALNLSDVSLHAFELADKDGYLATNSVLLDSALIARAYGELNGGTRNLPDAMDSLHLRNETVDDWLSSATSFTEAAQSRPAVIVVFSPFLRAIAADLESKLSEAALKFCQLTDLRSFAHGRHLWLGARSAECVLLALVEPALEPLWAATRAMLPPEVPTLTMHFAGSEPRDLLAGLVAEMHLVKLIARSAGVDPAKPAIPKFARNLHYIDLAPLVPVPKPSSDRGEQAKYEVLGARWPSIPKGNSMRRARQAFEAALTNQTFRAIVFDYDGTLCASKRIDLKPTQPVVAQLQRLIDAGVHIGIATGRGDSVQQHIEAVFPLHTEAIHLGLYNCGWMSPASTAIPLATSSSEFLNHVTRIVGRLKALGVPIDTIRATHPFQVSIRFLEGVDTETSWFVIADALRQAGLDMSRVVRSKHSVDVLAEQVNKARLIAHMAQHSKIQPHQILTMGDQGAWPGNDASLLEHRFSLSVDVPSRRLDRGWKLAPTHRRNVDATLWYLARLSIGNGGTFAVQFPEHTDERP